MFESVEYSPPPMLQEKQKIVAFYRVDRAYLTCGAETRSDSNNLTASR
jgi:hypothetical protein